jgi:hypothetical protein
MTARFIGGFLEELASAKADEETVCELKDAYNLGQADDRCLVTLASPRREVIKGARRVAENGNELLEHLCLLLGLGFKKSLKYGKLFFKALQSSCLFFNGSI